MEDTSEAVLSALAALVERHAFDDISASMVATAIGMSERTVTRLFPTRGHLLEGLAQWLRRNAFETPNFTTVSQLRNHVIHAFQEFQQAPHLATILARAEALPPLGGPAASELTLAISRTIRTTYPAMPSRDYLRLVAVIRLHSGAAFWCAMKSPGPEAEQDATNAFLTSLDLALTRLSLQAPARIDNA